MPEGVKVTVDIRKARSRLRGLLGRLRDPRVGLEMIAERMFRRAKECFEKQQSPEGIPWQPLTPSYLMSKGDAQILYRSGCLFRSIHRGVIGNRAFIATAPLPYAAIHQFGGRTRPREIRPRKKKALAFMLAGGEGKVICKLVRHPGSMIPARPYLGFPAHDQQAVIKDLEDYLARKEQRQ